MFVLKSKVDLWSGDLFMKLNMWWEFIASYVSSLHHISRIFIFIGLLSLLIFAPSIVTFVNRYQL